MTRITIYMNFLSCCYKTCVTESATNNNKSACITLLNKQQRILQVEQIIMARKTKISSIKQFGMSYVQYNILQAMTIMLASTGTDSYNLKCPDRSQRKIRAKSVCNSKEENYSCMLDLQKRTFIESCSFTSDFVRPGKKFFVAKKIYI